MSRAGIAAVLLLLLVGCDQDKALDGEVAALDDEVLALYMSPQSSTAGVLDGGGYVHVFDADGSHRSIETSVMDAGGLVWNANGLHFADSENDYLLNDTGLTTVTSPKPDMQSSLHDMGDAVVGVYNEGLVAENAYQMQLVETRTKESTSTAISGMIGAVAQCDDALYGVGEATGPFMEEYPPQPDGMPSWVLYEIWPEAQQVIGVADGSNINDFASDAPCHDGVIYAVNTASDDPSTAVNLRHVLVSWDTRTGERKQVDLVSSAGVPLEIDADGYSYFDSGSLVDGKLYWLNSDGVVRATDLSDGTTTDVVDTGLTEAVPGAAVSVDFVGGDVYVLHFPGEGGDSPQLYRFSLTSGEGETVLAAEGIDPVVSIDLIPRGIAVSPSLLDG